MTRQSIMLWQVGAQSEMNKEEKEEKVGINDKDDDYDVVKIKITLYTVSTSVHNQLSNWWKLRPFWWEKMGQLLSQQHPESWARILMTMTPWNWLQNYPISHDSCSWQSLQMHPNCQKIQFPAQHTTNKKHWMSQKKMICKSWVQSGSHFSKIKVKTPKETQLNQCGVAPFSYQAQRSNQQDTKKCTLDSSTPKTFNFWQNTEKLQSAYTIKT